MIGTVPNSFGVQLREVNHCHGKGSKGHPCRYGPVTSLDPYRTWTLRRDQVARGISFDTLNRRLPKAIEQRLIDGEATGEDIIGLLPNRRAGAYWWDGHTDQAGAAPFEYAAGDSAGEEPLTKWKDLGGGGDVQMVFVGDRPKGMPLVSDWDSSVKPGTKISITDVYYNAGNGWRKAPLRKPLLVRTW